MAFISRGFKGKRRDVASSSRVPPGQHVVNDFPVLSAGPTPRVPLADWTFSIVGEVDEPKVWTWDEFRKLPSETRGMSPYAAMTASSANAPGSPA